VKEIRTSQPLTITVIGLGYVGCVSAACLAKLGFRVIGVDSDEFKVRSVLAGRSPFFEPELEQLVADGIATGRLSAGTSLAEAVVESDVALVCVGTPSDRNGNLGLDQLRRVVAELAGIAPDLRKRLIVAVRSTVFPGTCEQEVIPAFDKYPGVAVVSNPEFLREGSAVRDFFEPSLIVVGGTEAAAVRKVAEIYDGLGTPCMVGLRTAEMIKYACNAFHAVKIAFANEIGALSERLAVDPQEVMRTLASDVKLNASAAYLKPGFAFGGSCLPKDLRALNYRASRLDLNLPLLSSTLVSNSEHLERAIGRVLELSPARIGVVGLAFKESTDDLRESPVIGVLERLIGKGRDVRVFDPHIQLETIYGANRRFIEQVIPHIGRLLQRSLDDVLDWADYLVVAQKPSPETADRVCASGLPVIDLVGAGVERTVESVARLV
jgi:GDP-mannose 6-dehydrogenase